MPVYGEELYGEGLYGEGSDNTKFFLRYLVETQPPPYRKFKDFLQRILLPSAEDLSRVHQTLDRLHELIDPSLVDEEWCRWLLTEVMGWALVPDGYPLQRLRRLLSNLAAHYQRRYTVSPNTSKSYGSLDEQLHDAESGDGLRLLLREFGIVAQVYDRPIYVGSYVGARGISRPLNVWVRILYFEPCEFPRNNYIGNYIGHTYAYRTKPLVTKEFALALCEWSRPAGVRMIVEFVTDAKGKRVNVQLYDQPASLTVGKPMTQEQHISE